MAAASIGCWSKKALSPFLLHHPLSPIGYKQLLINTIFDKNSRVVSAISRYCLLAVNSPAKNNASDKIIELIKTYPAEIVLVAIAPLTNIALAIKKDPATMQKLKEIILMAGAIKVPGNQNRVAEYNIFADPESAEIIADGIKISSDFVDNDLAQRKKPQKVEVTSNGALLEMGVKDPLVKRTENYKSTFNDTYLELIKELSILFKNIAENSSGKIDNHVKTICSRVVNTLVADKNLVINLTNLRDKNDDYLVQHSLNVAIFSINIACSIGYNEKQIFELAFGALLSDIGMMKINKDLLAKKGILNSEERRAIERHPAFSLDYLNYIKGIPTSLPYIIYQSHEKLDGTGYPKGRPSFLIHEFAKIIAIADMFDSLCSDRPWRKALIPYKAMEEIIRMAGQKKIDGKIIRQWLFSISLFPVGSYVSLNDTSVAKVISSNPSDFTRPNLRAMSKDGANLSEPATIVLGDNKALRITHAVSQSEVQFGVLDGF